MEKYYVNVSKLCTEWFSNPECTLLHRVGAPACEYADGDYSWWLNGNLHREDGPAICLNGHKEWYIDGKQHRTDGPAFEAADGDKLWYLDGKAMSQEEHTRRTAPAQEMTVAQIEAALGKRIKIVK